ncbi:hypothetical protein A2U01_0063830, partial [Trifolium medium]|nr:hypothetical protein [Trifolium medium]
SSLTAVENAVKDMPAVILAMLEKSLGKSLQVSESSVLTQNKTDVSGKLRETMTEMDGEGSSGGKTSPLRSNVSTEFRHAARKVELPSFDGKDHAGWISRAEIYFRVQGTPPEI